MKRQPLYKLVLITCCLGLQGLWTGGSGLRAQNLLTMEKAMDIAVESSPDIKQTELALVQSQERLNAQRARLKSQFRITLDPLWSLRTGGSIGCIKCKGHRKQGRCSHIFVM